MSDKKPSPGPFSVKRTYSNLSHHDVFVVLDANGQAVCDCDSESDAKMHADAPAMLELLRKHEWGPDAGYCEECGAHAGRDRHDRNCAWGALLDKHGRTP